MTLEEMIYAEEKRQEKTVELIASENFCSARVQRIMGTCLTNKYAEGYPGNRYYGGCRYVDMIEDYCREKWREVFDPEYHVNVQPHSGTQANIAAYLAVLKPGDTILSMSLANGGHLSHGAPANISSSLYNIVHYGVDENGYIDYEDVAAKIDQYKPNLVLAGASAYPRIIDFARFRACVDAAEGCKPLLMADLAHIAGLVAGGAHPTPFGYADIITTTTHKTLRGPRGALIFARPEFGKKVDSAVFPGNQGGPLMHVIAAKAACAEEALEPEYKDYTRRIVSNCAAMADEFLSLGYELTTGGTDNHLLLLDFTRTHPTVTGRAVQDACDEQGITLNKNCVPGEKRGPRETSGVRIGSAAMTTRGWGEDDFRKVVRRIDRVIRTLAQQS